MLLRSASGPEVKGSAIRRGIGNYSPERGRASVTFITELSALLGKQCTPFNPAFPFSLHSTPPSIYSFSSSNLNPTDPECLFLSFVFPPFILARPLPISPLLALGEKERERERESERVRERERERERPGAIWWATGWTTTGPFFSLALSSFFFLSVLSTELSTLTSPVISPNSVTLLSSSQIVYKIIQRSSTTILVWFRIVTKYENGVLYDEKMINHVGIARWRRSVFRLIRKFWIGIRLW